MPTRRRWHRRGEYVVANPFFLSFFTIPIQMVLLPAIVLMLPVGPELWAGSEGKARVGIDYAFCAGDGWTVLNGLGCMAGPALSAQPIASQP